LRQETVSPWRFPRLTRRSINTDGERQVSGSLQVWFRNGGWPVDAAGMGINQKFTPNQTDRIFSEFFAI
jgi:hypothetical protein